ncbi:MAG: alpha-L-arabinofuranosidase C-terminal domain-containing protein [Candidatus Bathyarchaeia archaeon]
MECKGFVDATSPIGRFDRRCYGQFIEHLGKCIYGGIWVGEASKIPNVKGFRQDVLEAIRELKPQIVRWPGGNFASGYHWIDGIGPRHQRPRRFDMAWGSEESNEFGTDEFLEWCRLVGADPFIVVNAGNGVPSEAAAWVEYCNLAGRTYYASLRRSHGIEKPYGVRLWGIGNELYGRWQVGFCIDGKECARRTIEFSNEMRKVDPSIELVAVGCEDPEWNLSMVKEAGEYFDYLSIHIYTRGGRPYRELVASPVDVERRLMGVYRLIEGARRRYGVKREIKLAFDEWNVWYPEAKAPLHEQITGVGDAIFTGLILNALQRLCRIVPIGGFAQTVNVLPLIIASDDGRIVLTPQYHVFKMYASCDADLVLRTSADSPAYLSQELGDYVPFVDISATLGTKGECLHLYAVNRHEKEPAELEVSFRGFKPQRALGEYISGASEEDRNTLDEPSRVGIEKLDARIEGGKLFAFLKPHSINVITIKGEPSVNMN